MKRKSKQDLTEIEHNIRVIAEISRAKYAPAEKEVNEEFVAFAKSPLTILVRARNRNAGNYIAPSSRYKSYEIKEMYATATHSTN
jgi:hypothetical protein